MLIATEAIHDRLAVTELEREEELWLMSEAEAATIADPLANIANRHAGAATVSADLGDLIAAGLAAGAYLMTNTIRAYKLRRAQKRAGWTPPAPDDSEDS